MKFEIISLGAGVQSSTMALMAAHGEITPMPDAAVFADKTGFVNRGGVEEQWPIDKNQQWLSLK